VALTPPKVTLVGPVKLLPVITTLGPTGSLVGAKLEIVGVTRNLRLPVKVRLGVTTLIVPVVAGAWHGALDFGTRGQREFSRRAVERHAGHARAFMFGFLKGRGRAYLLNN
jgi:hypothetical protein